MKKLLIIILFSIPVCAQTIIQTSAQFGMKCDGVTDDTQRFLNAIGTGGGSQNIYIIFVNGTCNIKSINPITVANYVTLDFTQQGALFLASGSSMTINAAVVDPDYHPVFTGTGTYTITPRNPTSCASITGGIACSSSGANTPANTSYYYLSKNCSGLTNCTQIFGDTQFVIDATSNSTTTVTCPNNDCNFTSADVGKVVWATTQGTLPSLLEITSLVCGQTTIATVNSAQSITLNLACTASGSGNVVLIWGHNDGSTLHALDGNGTGCVTLQPFSGAYIMVDQAEFIVPANCSLSSTGNQPLFSGKNWGAVVPNSAFIMTPSFNYATCVGASQALGNIACFGTGLGQINDLFIWGTGLQAATNANCNNAANKAILVAQKNTGSFTGLNVAGVCPGTTGQGVVLDNIDEFWSGGGAQFVLSNPCAVYSVVFTSVIDCRNDGITSSYGLSVNGAGYDTDVSSWPIVGAVIFNNGTLISRGTHFGASTSTCALQVQGTWLSYGDFVGVDVSNSSTNSSLCFSSGGTVQMINTKINQAGGGGSAILFGAGTLTSSGGNTIVGQLTQTAAPTGLVGWDILQGSCTGTVASASTIGLFNLGNNTTTTCTSTTTNLGPVMGKAGNVYGFECYAGTAGNQAADACTVMKNNVASSMTCSLNGATSCIDGATGHQFTYAIGDIITVKVVSGTSTTLANVKASVIAW